MGDYHHTDRVPAGSPHRGGAEAGSPGPVAGWLALPAYLKSLLLVAATTLLCHGVRRYLEPTNLMMIYLLAVVAAAGYLGRNAAIFTALGSVLTFDFFFVPPRFTLVVEDSEYVVTFIAFFTVGVTISTLVATARERARLIEEREAETASLYRLSRDLSVASDVKGVLDAIMRNAERTVQAPVAVLLPQGDALAVEGKSEGVVLDGAEMVVAEWVFKSGNAAGCGTPRMTSAALLYLPLRSGARMVGVLGVKLPAMHGGVPQRTRRLLDSFAAQSAMAIERVYLAEQAEKAQIMAARDTLERALLNSISHDLRTPLVSIGGALGALKGMVLSGPRAQELIDTAAEQAERLNRFVGNLLDMTRLEAGALRPRVEPCDVQDLVGCALAALEERLEGRPVTTELPAELPLLCIDLVLMTQVLVNVLDNALKYSPAESTISIGARVEGAALEVVVADRGPGIPGEELARVFEKFHRIPVPEGTAGTGLGLAICKGIVEVHGGRIRAENREGGGLRVVITLPLPQVDPQKEGT